jgi:hypothetical protein
MRDKPALSRHVLEGLATGDFDLIIARSTRLSAMSKEAGWHGYENPDYDHQSAPFRRHVDSLLGAAKGKNFDADGAGLDGHRGPPSAVCRSRGARAGE